MDDANRSAAAETLRKVATAYGVFVKRGLHDYNTKRSRDVKLESVDGLIFWSRSWPGHTHTAVKLTVHSRGSIPPMRETARRNFVE